MIIEKMPDPFEAILVKNTYSEKELVDIWKELDFLTRKDVLLTPEMTASAKDSQGKFLKNNKSVFLFQIYQKQEISPIISYTSKIFSVEVGNFYKKINPMHQMFFSINQRSLLLNYYENNDFYDYHTDKSVYTSVTYLFKEPKSFTGGDITFKINEHEYTQKIENNLSIVFPSSYLHSVSPIKMKEENEEFSGLGRYCINQFGFISI
jgi:Rps23 Pro-64 3,4-dihydroxylase Tpa1-like proline 4-hydroxylase